MTGLTAFSAPETPAAAPIARVGQLAPADAKDPDKRMEALTANVTEGALRAVAADGAVVECPLRHTDVKADVTGFIARVKVTQTFYNPLAEKIEAVYVFPLPHKSAVDDMTMVIGERRIVGIIKRRAEARSIYEQALAQGATAALLEQERPNIFTQSVGNIDPQQTINIEISYVDVLDYDMGTYEFHFPMVVGPRYIPGGATSTIPPVPKELQGKVGELDKNEVPEGPDKPKGTGWAPDTDRVPDASRITPPVLKPGFRNGHDVSLSVALDAGVPIRDLKVSNHKADVKQTGKSTATAAILPADSIPNKDFVLRYSVVGDKPEMAVLSHVDKRGQGYFMLMIQPKEDERLKNAPAREIVFLIDVSGSMSGEPTAKNSEVVQKMLRLCKPSDTVQVITFESQSQKLFEKPVPVTPENIQKALGFAQGIRGSGGTEMLKGIRMALEEPPDPERVRIVMMLTDGFIGNEAEIIAEVGKRAGDRIKFWCIGIGSAPNRFLTDGVARQGGGMSKVLGLKDDSEPVVQEVMTRIHQAQLAKVKIDWGGMNVFETYPARIPELWPGAPIVLFGLYQAGGRANVTVSGTAEGQPVNWPLAVDFPVKEPGHDVLAKVWARNKIEDLMQQTYYQGAPEVEELVTQIALDYSLMSQYTSFVAVDESKIGKLTEPAKPPRRMLVAVPIPEGTRYEGFFGGDGEKLDDMAMAHGAPDWITSGGHMMGLGQGGGGAPATMAPLRRLESKSAVTNGRSWGGYIRGSLSPSPSGPASDPSGVKYMKTGTASRAAKPSVAMYNGAARFRRDSGVDLDKYENRSGGWSFLGGALSEDAGKLSERASQALKEAEDLRKKGDLPSARSRFAYAYLLAIAAGNLGGYSNSADAALAGVESTGDELVKSWAKAAPKLDAKLDLVIRDRSMAQALADVAMAADFPFKLVDGSIEDACSVTNRKDLRVTYLDLRGATVREALDWLAQPARMSWWLAKGSPVVGTCRRGDVASPWVYDVSLIALPEAKEWEAIKENDKRIAAFKKSADDFIAAVRASLGLKDDVAWYAPGQLLVFADESTHAKTAQLFADLADPKAKVPAGLAELHKLTSKRPDASGGKAAADKALAASEKLRVHGAMGEFSWRLLAAAAQGDLDVEALTELQVAWRSPCAAELLGNEKTWVPMRSVWAIVEASRALGDGGDTPSFGETGRRMETLWPVKAESLRGRPELKELAALAKAVREAAKKPAEDALAELKKSPDQPVPYFRALYATLALSDDAEFVAKASPLLTTARPDGSPLAAASKVAAALLAPAGKIDSKSLADVIATAVKGDDMTVLTALACRRAGGDAWNAFRVASKDLLGSQPLDGSVIVLVNSLARANLPVVVAAK